MSNRLARHAAGSPVRRHRDRISPTFGNGARRGTSSLPTRGTTVRGSTKLTPQRGVPRRARAHGPSPPMVPAMVPAASRHQPFPNVGHVGATHRAQSGKAAPGQDQSDIWERHGRGSAEPGGARGTTVRTEPRRQRNHGSPSPAHGSDCRGPAPRHHRPVVPKCRTRWGDTPRAGRQDGSKTGSVRHLERCEPHARRECRELRLLRRRVRGGGRPGVRRAGTAARWWRRRRRGRRRVLRSSDRCRPQCL